MATIWQKAGFFINNHRGGDMPFLATRAYEAGFRVMIPLVLQGKNRQDLGGIAVPRSFLEMLRERGHQVVPYQSLFAKTVEAAQEEAHAAARFISDHRGLIDGWIANPENTYEYSQPTGFCAPCFEASQGYVNAFRAAMPKPFPLGISSYAHFSLHDLWWAPWLNRGDARALPQAYSNMFGAASRARTTFDSTIDVNQPHNPMYHPSTGAVIPGFPLSYWHPTLGNWGAGGGVRPGWEDVADGAQQNVVELIECKAMPYGPHFWGFSVYDLEHQTISSLNTYGEAIGRYQLAKVT